MNKKKNRKIYQSVLETKMEETREGRGNCNSYGLLLYFSN